MYRKGSSKNNMKRHTIRERVTIYPFFKKNNRKEVNCMDLYYLYNRGPPAMTGVLKEKVKDAVLNRCVKSLIFRFNNDKGG